MLSADVSYFARTNHHGNSRSFGIRQADRLSHIHVIGKTGTGKSTLLKSLVLQDMVASRGFALVDPHGDLADAIIEFARVKGFTNIRYLNAADPNQPYGYNPLRKVRADRIPLAVSGLLETLKKLWPDAWGVRMEHVLRNSLYALLERDGSQLPDLLRLYRDEQFRKAIAANIQNETVRNFWRHEFENYQPRQRAEAVAPIQNKIGALLADPMLYRILVEPKIALSFRAMMDKGEMLVVNVGKGRIGEDSALLLGGLIVSTIGLAAFSRAESDSRRQFTLHVDEFQNFTTLMIANMMSELRKYGVGMVLANQYLKQMEPEIEHAILGNVGTLISFRVGPNDAQVLAREFEPKFEARDLLYLPNHDLYLKLMIDGTPSQPFSGRSLTETEALNAAKASL
ncbi:MAG: type IV secretory system conjugative DNA transfer family protein [Alphaproteobacteria bacterium]|nr:type IV secretory system conjugative DNA transfer family protein [Alphaproteobacteria bacterium]